MTKKSSKAKKASDKQNYPVLREFFEGYLHQDFRDEFDSVEGAARAFCRDAGSEQVDALRSEWDQLRDSLKNKKIAEVQKALAHLGAMWRPGNDREFRALDSVLNPG